ncbi:hypothetical protein K461DRAFT_265842 [Myriangium duriaei CBS 260.36]|uniref:Arrestin-like N-terminal domain-containing protein n=1 Tax=Myriangium duriaei CBS 260.36 TaxID=1168546 RepID=A0A9P4JB89_9PEZI|nr:hypothetical protein K461DRAFT_265842 [Myriangium duriaei CBS 260.36]
MTDPPQYELTASERSAGTPLLNLEIEVDSLDRPHRPGDHICGRVIYNLQTRGSVDDVDIEFKGEIRTTVKHNDPTSSFRCSNERILLFRQVHRLFSDTRMIRAQILEWPFDFAVPTSASYRRPSKKARYADRFCRSAWIPLPPTFSSSDAGFHCNDNADIVYTLKVRMNERRIKKNVVIDPAPSFPPHAGPGFGGRTFTTCAWSSEVLRPFPLTLKQKLQRTLTTTNPKLARPCITFEPVLTLPRRIAVGQTLPLSMKIHWRRPEKRRNPNDPKNPSLVLLGLEFRLTSYTYIRAEGCGREAQHREPSWVYNDLDVRLPLDGTYVTVLPDWSLNPLRKTSMEILPDISTWTVSRQYKLEARAEFVHVESGHIFTSQFSNVPISLLPAHLTPEEAERMQTVPPQQVPHFEEPDRSVDLPPSYEEVFCDRPRRPYDVGPYIDYSSRELGATVARANAEIGTLLEL